MVARDAKKLIDIRTRNGCGKRSYVRASAQRTTKVDSHID